TRDGRRQQRLRRAHGGVVDGRPAQPRLLQNVLGVADGAEHAVGEAQEAWPLAFKGVEGGAQAGKMRVASRGGNVPTPPIGAHAKGGTARSEKWETRPAASSRFATRTSGRSPHGARRALYSPDIRWRTDE